MKWLTAILVLAIVLIAGCTQQSVVSKNQTTGVTTTQENSVFTEKLITKSSDVEGTLTKNKITKTVDLQMKQYINDTQEEAFSFFTLRGGLNFTCMLISGIFINATQSKPQNFTNNDLQGYEFSSMKIEYIDKETEEKIADCSLTGMNSEKPVWSFNFYRNESSEEYGNLIQGEGAFDCPKLSNVYYLSIYSGEGRDGKKHLYLDVDFFKNAQFSDGWELINPTMSTYESPPYCESGSYEGESVNKLYCRVIDIGGYNPMLEKSYVGNNGTIEKTDYLFVKTIVFNVKESEIWSNIEKMDVLSSLLTTSYETSLCSKSMS